MNSGALHDDMVTAEELGKSFIPGDGTSNMVFDSAPGAIGRAMTERHRPKAGDPFLVTYSDERAWSFPR